MRDAPRGTGRRRRPALRRRAGALLAAAALVISQALGVVGATREVARADEAPSSITIAHTQFYSSGVGMTDASSLPSLRFTAAGNQVVYCADAGLHGPRAGETLSNRTRGNLVLDYLLHYGYGGAGYSGSVNGHTGEEAQAVTQLAVWWATSTPNGTWDTRRLAAAGREFYDQAVSAADEGAAYAGSSWMYGEKSDTNQRIVAQTLRTGGIELRKSSGNAAVSGDSSLYSLAGAEYGVYADEACTSLVTTLVTDSSGRASTSGLAVGAYYVQELTPASGYALDVTAHEVTVKATGATALDVSDAPQCAPVSVLARKLDAESGEGAAQGDAALAGAEFTVRYYDGIYASAAELPESPTRTWVIRTGDDGAAALDEAHLVSGDALYRSLDGSVVVPLGTIAVQETTAPEGYLLPEDAEASIARVTSSGTDELLAAVGEHVLDDEVVRGGVSVPKIDHELQEGVSQGDATLAGAELSVVNASASSVIVDGRSVAPGEEALVLTTDADGVAASAADALPYGTYAIREKTPPTGYLLNETWSQTFAVRQDGQVVDLSDVPLADEVERGGALVAKTDAELEDATAQGDATLAGAVISVVNRSAGPVLVGGVLYQPGDEVMTIVTGAVGAGQSLADALPFGTYEAREKGASEGYLVNEGWSQTFEISSDGQLVSLESLPEQVARGGVTVAKVDAERQAASPQGDATLAGGELTVYNRSAAPVLVDGTLRGVGEAVTTIVTDESGIAATAADALPYGTYEVRETRAPEGYLVSDGWSQTFEIRADGQMAELVSLNEAVADDVARGGVEVLKVDRERASADTDASRAIGAASLAGATLEVTNVSAHEVLVGGVACAPGEVALTLVTDESGMARSAADALPYGTYEIREVAPPEGYLLNEAWSRTFSVRADGELVSLTDEADALDDQAIRGDVAFTKAEEGTQSRMANVPFLMTSQTTGERHVLVSDENGMVDTSAGWNAHESATNANDAALLDDGTVNESTLDARAGVWFSGDKDAQLPADDALGALPYDTYLIEELPCSANEGHLLVSTLVTVARDAVTLDLGTMDDEVVPEPALDTELTYGGAKQAPAEAGLTLVDTIRYEDLRRAGTYRIVDELHALGADGEDLGVVATAERELVPELSAGALEIVFEGVDATGLSGCRLVASVSVYEGERLVASHASLDDEGQTVRIPSVGTTLLSDATSDHDAPSYAASTVTDTVRADNLTVGERYEVRGELRVVETDEAGDPAAGETVSEASTSFVATSESEQVGLTFELDGRALAGRSVYASETLLAGGVELASHNDPSDENQTVRLPAIATRAHNAATESQTSPADASQTLVDEVELTNLIEGRSYTLVSSAHARIESEDGSAADGGQLMTPDGTPAQAELTFVATSSEMTLEVEVAYDARELEGRDIVAFEELLDENGVLLARHADVDDAQQTLLVPAVGTSAADGWDGDAEALPAPDATIVDTVRYDNVEPGREYVVSGHLRLRERDESGELVDAGPLLDANGEAVTAEATFTPEESSGTVEVAFAFDASGLDGATTVAYETLSTDGVVVAAHANIADEAQTVTLRAPDAEPQSPSGPLGAMPSTGEAVSLAALAGIGGVATVAISLALRRRRR